MEAGVRAGAEAGAGAEAEAGAGAVTGVGRERKHNRIGTRTVGKRARNWMCAAWDGIGRDGTKMQWNATATAQGERHKKAIKTRPERHERALKGKEVTEIFLLSLNGILPVSRTMALRNDIGSDTVTSGRWCGQLWRSLPMMMGICNSSITSHLI